MAKVKKKKRRLKIKNLFILIILIGGIVYSFTSYKQYLEVQEKNRVKAEQKRIEEEKKIKYEKCLNKRYEPYKSKGNLEDKTIEIDNSKTIYVTDESSGLSEELDKKIVELNTYISTNYSASVYYEDDKTGFTYAYDEDKVYYGASLIKIVEALYIFDNNIDLNKTIKYESKYVAAYSDGMKKRKVGDEVTIKDLLSYAIMYSDNSAHFMISDFIGKDNLRTYGKSLGAVNILSSGDTFGNQSAIDTNIYLKHAKEVIDNNENGYLLEEWMLNTYYNSLYLTDESNNNVAHKYGWYSYFYHDIGIVYENNPYYISILTNHGTGNYTKVVKDIHSKINELHNLFHETRKNVCYDEVYN